MGQTMTTEEVRYEYLQYVISSALHQMKLNGMVK